MYFEKKTEILIGRGGSRLWNSEGMGGNAFWNFRRQGGVKTWKPSVVRYGYFLELPISSFFKVVEMEVIDSSVIASKNCHGFN